jgi:hypothetical protein
MMKIDTDNLSEAELIDLNHRVVERLRFLNQMRAHSEMLEFRIGERVTFHPQVHPRLLDRDPLQSQNGHRNHRHRAALERCAGATAESRIAGADGRQQPKSSSAEKRLTV